jgi:polysaccharide export outer membrane protein
MKLHFRLFIMLAMIGLFSCRSSKELIYLKDTSDDVLVKGLSTNIKSNILKPGDILYVSIKSMNPEVNQLYNPESNMETATGQGYMKYTTPSGAYLYGFEIDAQGFIQLPMLGNLKVAGISVAQAQTLVQKRTDEVLNGAAVKVKLLNFKVTVSGEVRNPGVYYNYNNSMNVLELLAMANGNTDFATIKTVKVIRPTEDGGKAFTLDLSSTESCNSEGFFLQPNDFVIVQPDRFKNFQLNSQAISLVFSSVSVLIAVLSFVLK